MKTVGREIGTLVVVVLKAKNLPNKRNIGKQDPYCLVTLNGGGQRTKADKRGGQHPEWDQELRFTLFEDIEDGYGPPVHGDGSPPPLPPKNPTGPPSIAGGKFMKVACFADDARDPTQIGETNVDLTEVLTRGETDEWFPLSSKNKYAGEVYLELTFWSNEPAPKKKKAKSKNTQRTSQYGGAGSFIPFNSSPDRSHPVSRMPSSGSDFGQSATFRTTNSSLQLDLYKAPYEKRASSTNLSVVDAVTKELNGLGVSDVRPRRDTFPPINQHPRSTSAQFQPQTINGQGQNEQDQGSVFPVMQPHQPAYENTQPTSQPSSFQQQSRGPRYSLPNPPSSSGFVPPSGFHPLNQRKQDPAFPSRTGPTPAPGSYGMTPPVLPNPTGFAPIPSPAPAPSGFMPTSSSLPFQPGYHGSHYPVPATTPMPYGFPPLTMTIPPPPLKIQSQYPLSLPLNSSSPYHLTSSPIPDYGSTAHTPSPPQDAYSQLQGEQPAPNPNSRPLPQPSMLGRRRSTLPVPPGGGGITMSPTSSPSRPESIYSGGNYQQPIQPIQYNAPPPPPLPPHSNAAPLPPLPPPPPPPPQHSIVHSHSHSHSHSLPNQPQPWATNGQHGLPIPPVQQNGQQQNGHQALPVPPVQQSGLPPSPSRRLALPQPPTLQNPPTQQPVYVPPPPPLATTTMQPYSNRLPQPPIQYAQVHQPPFDGYPPQDERLYQQPTGSVWSYH